MSFFYAIENFVPIALDSVLPGKDKCAEEHMVEKSKVEEVKIFLTKNNGVLY